MSTEEILDHITSRDTHKVWLSACEIISLAQDRNSIVPFISHLPEIKKKTKGLEMGGMLAPNQRFVDYAIKIIEFHRDSTACTCNLYPGHEMTNPHKEVEKGNVEILKTTLMDGTWVDDYSVSCKKCSQRFTVTEREGHYTWWSWTKAST